MSKIKIKNINYQYALDDLYAGEIGKLVRSKRNRYMMSGTTRSPNRSIPITSQKGWCVEEGCLGIVLDFIPAEKDKYNSYSYPVDTQFYNNNFFWNCGKQSNVASAIVIEWIGKGLKETIILKPNENLERKGRLSSYQPDLLEEYIEPLTK